MKKMSLPAQLALITALFGGNVMAAIVDIKFDAQGRFAHEVDMPVGKTIEVCGALKAGVAVDWSFKNTAPLNFNIHFHKGEAVSYPFQQKGASNLAQKFTPEIAQDYCWMWTNRNLELVKLNVMLSTASVKPDPDVVKVDMAKVDADMTAGEIRTIDKDAKKIIPAGMGLVIRTEAEGMPEEAIIEDLETLQRQWESIIQEAGSTRAPALLNRDDDFIQRVLRDVYSSDVNRIVVDSHTGLKRVKQQLINWGGGKPPQGVLIDHHRERIPMLEYFRVNAAIREALKPRVDLPSGGYIIIERTEALTVIDVNSGSFTRSATARETVLWTNCEAATEIARQLRLRNIAGVIIVDFIDMDARRDQLQVLEHFNKALRADKSKPQISQLSELGLVELTRKRQGKNLYELFGRPCATCGGLGLLAHLPGESHDEEGESLERSAVSLRENRESRRLPEPRRELPATNDLSWEGDEATGENGDQDLELLNHPSYQERGRGGANRRRRRRVDAPAPKEGVSAKVTPWEEPTRYTPAPATVAPIISRSEPLFESSPSPAIEEFPISKEIEAPEDKRGRLPRRGGVKPAAEPPEMIYVEMTPDEQDVYAWMGISPIVLTTQELKNPKSANIFVTLPGQAPPALPVVVAEAPTIKDEDFAIAVETAPPQDSESISLKVRKKPSARVSPRVVDEPLLPSDLIEEAPLDAEPVLDEKPAPEPEEEALVTRRRRRRSSATTGE